jgi:dTMP kinase
MQDRFEQEEMEFHRRVRETYLALAQAHPQRIRVLDATGSIEEVHQRVLAVLKTAFPNLAWS